jgi:hypothetical protein
VSRKAGAIQIGNKKAPHESEAGYIIQYNMALTFALHFCTAFEAFVFRKSKISETPTSKNLSGSALPTLYI